MSLTGLLSEVIRGWPAYHAKVLVDENDRVYEIVTAEIPSVIKSWSPNPERYKFAGRTGMGNIAGAPYFATFNLDITTGAKHGYYLVYLLSADMQRLVLLIGFGVYQFQDHFGATKKMFEVLQTAARNMRGATEHLANSILKVTKSRTNSVPVHLDNGNFRLLRGYEKCSIYSLTYDVANLPSEEELATDYREYLRLYDRMAESMLLPDIGSYVYELADTVESSPAEPSVAIEEPFVPRQFSKRNKGSDSPAGSPGNRYSKQADKAGKRGEEYVVDFERRRLRSAGRQDLAEQVVWHRTSQTNRTPGWDVTSYEVSGDERLIEVKASIGTAINDVELTPNEWMQANAHIDSGRYWIYLVSDVFKRPTIQAVQNPARMVNEGTLTVGVARHILWLGKREAR